MHLLPAGEIRTGDGRGPYRVRDAAALMAASLSAGDRLPIDENHATGLAAPRGEPAPARGWIVELRARALVLRPTNLERIKPATNRCQLNLRGRADRIRALQVH